VTHGPAMDPRLPDDQVNLPRVHPLREAALLVLAMVAIGVVAMALIANLVDLMVFAIPPRLEPSLVGATWPEFAATAEPQSEESARVLKVQDLLDQLSAGWEDCPYDFQLQIIDEETPNALALPGGLILVTSGLLEESGSENALAFVLGHEVGHFRDRDHLRVLGRTALFSLILGAVGLGGGETQILGAAGLLTNLGFSREQELKADRFGLELFQRHYGHVAESWSFFEQRADEDSWAAALPQFASTHPGSGERAEELREYARAHGWRLEGPVRSKL
jgi:Zn-dependent protease with chaperone function